MKSWILTFTIIALAVVGCGSGADDPIYPIYSTPVLPLKTEVGSAGSNHRLWGAWDVTIGTDRNSVEIHALRTAEMHLNMVKILETPPCLNCLTIKNIHQVEPNVLEADVTLKHPYPGLVKFNGFDVRGIFIAQADFVFPVSGRMAGTGDSVPRMLNADGFTTLFNPTEYPQSGPNLPILKYTPGKLATGGDLSATLNPFIAYRREAPRRMFEAGGVETRTVRIYAPPGPIHFGYAVDACWEPVDVVIDPLNDFPPEANCLEAYRISVTMDE